MKISTSGFKVRFHASAVCRMPTRDTAVARATEKSPIRDLFQFGFEKTRTGRALPRAARAAGARAGAPARGGDLTSE